MARRSRRLRAAVGGALAVLLAAVPAAGAVTGRDGQGRPYLDVRAEAIRAARGPGGAPLRILPPDARAARTRLLARIGPVAVLDADPVTLTPRALGRLDGALTGAQAGDPADIALRYVAEHASALGVGATDLTGLRPSGRVTAGGVTYLRWRQTAGGIPFVDNELRAAVDGDGRVIAVLGAPRPDLTVSTSTPSLDAAQAREVLGRDVGAGRAATVAGGPDGAERETRFSTGDRASLVLFGDTGGTRLAWQLTYDAGEGGWYDGVVDATTGRVLRRADLVRPVSASVFDNYPGAPIGGAPRAVTLDPFLTPGATTLRGPFAHAWSDIDDQSADPVVEAAAPAEEVAPGAYPFTDFTAGLGAAGACDTAHRCSWDQAANGWEANRRQNAVQAFWYVNHFHDHLAAPPIGFTAASGGFEGADAVDVQTDNGANVAAGLPGAGDTDQADMTTPPDGIPPRMQMYLFRNGPGSPFRAVNGGDDASIVYHEYTHGLSNRLITDASGLGALNAPQSAAMGEGWSDWYAKDLVVREGLQPDTAADGEVDMGAYVDAIPNRIRSQPLDCPVGSLSARCPGAPLAGPGGYTYGDFGRIAGAPETHADGEIWGETLWDVRRALGSDVSEALVTGGMRLSPPEPSFLEMRNAILLADVASYRGAHLDALWAVFARRGMGLQATTADANDTTPVEDFTAPAAAGGGPLGGGPPTAAGSAATPATDAGATPQAGLSRPAAGVRAPARPAVRIAASRTRGRVTVTVRCFAACTATATMTAARTTARRLRLGAATRIARATRRLAASGRRTFALRLPAGLLRRPAARRVAAVPVTITVAVRDRRGATTTVHRAVRVRTG
jgi:hypothetical protein